MKYKRFEDLPVWQAAIGLAGRIFRLVDDRSFNGRGDLRNQLQRAATSISNNIAEGFERGTTQELITFIYYSRGSAGDVRSMLHLCDWLPYFGDFKSQISDLRSLCESISRQLRAWADSLQNTDIKGQRYLTDRVRQEYDQKQRAAAFWAELDRIRARGTRRSVRDGQRRQPSELSARRIPSLHITRFSNANSPCAPAGKSRRTP